MAKWDRSSADSFCTGIFWESLSLIQRNLFHGLKVVFGAPHKQGGVWLRLKFGRLNIFSLVWSGLVWLKRVWLFGCHSCPYISIFSLHTLQKPTKIWVINIKQCEIESIKDLASFNSSMGCYKLYCVISSYFKCSSYFTHSLQPNFSQTPAE